MNIIHLLIGDRWNHETAIYYCVVQEACRLVYVSSCMMGTRKFGLKRTDYGDYFRDKHPRP